jgi:hypothetical protein
MNQLGSKDLSRDFLLNYVISFVFRLHLMLHACCNILDVKKQLKRGNEALSSIKHQMTCHQCIHVAPVILVVLHVLHMFHRPCVHMLSCDVLYQIWLCFKVTLHRF